jgi:hypothetical protein
MAESLCPDGTAGGRPDSKWQRACLVGASVAASSAQQTEAMSSVYGGPERGVKDPLCTMPKSPEGSVEHSKDRSTL